MSTMGDIGHKLFGTVLGGAYVLGASCATAQITPDRTIPNNSSVTINGGVFNITGGTQAGRNLFHSFQQFSVPTGSIASFNNGLDIQNVISRVTGGSISNIDGLIRANGNANLFLINPWGIVFSPNARLNIGGSFLASTASSLIFNNGFEFSATNPQAPPLLTVNIPTGLRFGDNPGSITVKGFGQPQVLDGVSSPENPTLAVDTGKTLALVGGNVSLDGGVLQASEGLVELGSLTAAGTVGINSDHSLSFPNGVERASVSLKNLSNVDVSGNGSGSIAINARNLDLQHSNLTADIGPSSNTPNLRVGDITINATETITLRQSSQIESRVSSNATDHGSDINITTGSLSIMNTSEVNTFTFGQGNAGNVNINARDHLEFDGARRGLASGIVNVALPQSTGDAGNININTGTLSLTNGAQVSAFSIGQGKAGSVTINAKDSVSLDGMQSEEMRSGINTFNSINSIGNNGGISITSGTLSISNGAQLNTSTSGMGDAGDVTIDARNHVWFNNGRILTSANQTATGLGGDVSITSGDISLANGSLIVLSTAGQGNAGNAFLTTHSLSLTNGSQLTLSTTGQGNAGNAFFTTRSLSLTDGSLLTSSTYNSSGNASAIWIKATESVNLSGRNPMNGLSTGIYSDTLNIATGSGGSITIDTNAFRLSDGAVIDVRTTTNGNAGSIAINSKTFEAMNGGELVSTSSGSGSAGNIQIHATDWVNVNGNDPTVETRRKVFNSSGDNILGGNLSNVEAASGLFVRSSGSGSAGDIEVNAPQIRLDNRGTLNAESTSGNGGNINLQSNLLLLRRGALISTTAGTAEGGGNGGNIMINTPNGFIVSVPNENSDITANAFKGSGGRVTINATGIYGLKVLSREDLARLLKTNDLTQLDFQSLPSSITAISQTNPNLNGQVNLNTPEVDPSRGLVTLPTITEVAPRLVNSNCANFNGTANGSQFTVTGRGGLPQNPDEPLTSDVVWSDTRLPVTTEQHQHKTHASKPKPQPIAIIPATGWVLNDKGEVMLISSAANAASVNTPTSCPVR
ncbi:MAG: filamentous hemagglutinin N-terminal domain-containing protein [Rhizonema sp. NSF051]|nr:filamentous hemagglutinin N-terminal domain-containing protein [Rhizonema sp. NSF051]